MGKLAKVEDYLVVGERLLLFALFFFLLIMEVLALILRNFFHESWAFEINEWVAQNAPHLVFGLGLLGASLGFSRGEVFRMEILNYLLPASIKEKINKAHYLVSLLILVLVFYLMIRYAVTSDEKNWLYFFYVPLWLLVIGKCFLRIFLSKLEPL
ncbi:MAG: hypothetical protein NZM25_07130 [Leptospiraceae bacterium]|nr:hypothetical protein [Leptospiraceae bacterium]MDW8307091.1 hypothetical protein [Leptospiraceae bacterium]